jgi:hypothetical protein
MTGSRTSLLAVKDVTTGPAGSHLLATGDRKLVKLDFWQLSEAQWQKVDDKFHQNFFRCRG